MVSLGSAFAERSVGKVTADEVNAVNTRVKSQNYTYLGFGPAVTSEYDGIVYHFTGGILREVHPRAAIRVNGDFNYNFKFNSDYYFMGAATLGLNFYFTTGDFSPYVTGNLGFGFDSEGNVGFATGGGVGITLFRASSTNMFIEPFCSAIIDGDKPMIFGLKIGVNL